MVETRKPFHEMQMVIFLLLLLLFLRSTAWIYKKEDLQTHTHNKKCTQYKKAAAEASVAGAFYTQSE